LKRLRRLQRLVNRLRESGIVIIRIRIEVVSPDTRVYGFSPWYPIEVREKEG
jgi:hypothetical protein